MIRVQREDFDIGAEIAALTDGRRDIGGVASFVGLVRDVAGGEFVGAMTLEHYPGMTEKKLQEIDDEANRRWPLVAEPDHPPLRAAGAGRPHRAGGHRLAAPAGGAGILRLPDRLAEDQGAVLEAGGDRHRRRNGSMRATATTRPPSAGLPESRAPNKTIWRIPGRAMTRPFFAGARKARRFCQTTINRGN